MQLGLCQITVLRRIQPLSTWLFHIFFGYYWLTGVSAAVKRFAYDKSGGFDPESDALEDNKLGQKVSAVGRIRFLPDVPVTTSGRRFKDGFFKNLFLYVKLYIDKFWLKKKRIALSDVR